MNIFAKSLLVITVAAVVSGCVQHRYPTEVKNELDDAIASNPDKLHRHVDSVFRRRMLMQRNFLHPCLMKQVMELLFILMWREL